MSDEEPESVGSIENERILADDDEEEEEIHNDDKEKGDEYDCDNIFGDLSNEIPEIGEIRSAARKFNDGHRYLLNKFLIQPTMLTRQMNIHFITHLMFKWKRNPDSIPYIKATKTELRELSKIIVKTINDEKSAEGTDQSTPQSTHDFGFRLVISTEESSPKEWVSLTCQLQNSEVIGDNSDLSKAERNLFLLMLDKMIAGNGKVSKNWVFNKVKQPECNMTFAKCQQFINQMVKLRWFRAKENDDDLELTPRTVSEMDPYIRAKFSHSLKNCQICNRIITRMAYSAQCVDCTAYYHYNCFKNATELAEKDEIECPKCTLVMELRVVELEMQVKINEAEAGPSSSPPPPINDNDKDDDDKGSDAGSPPQPSPKKKKQRETRVKKRRVAIESDIEEEDEQDGGGGRVKEEEDDE